MMGRVENASLVWYMCVVDSMGVVVVARISLLVRSDGGGFSESDVSILGALYASALKSGSLLWRYLRRVQQDLLARQAIPLWVHGHGA